MFKYSVEITKSKMIKELEFEGKTFKEEWYRTPTGSKTKGPAITSQLENEGMATDALLEALDEENFDDAWQSIREDY